MVARNSTTIADKYAERLFALEGTRRKVESLVGPRALSRTDAEQMYEALFMNVVTALEVMLEDLFVGLLVEGKGVASGQAGVGARAVVKSHKVARELTIVPGRKYADWLPFDRTEDRAKLFFRAGDLPPENCTT